MKLRLRTVDAFTDRPFTGNPAGVIRLDEVPVLPTDDWYASVAAELKLSETAFLQPADTSEADFRLRWFSPTVEVDLCGHATLAMSHCLFADGLAGPIRYATRSGLLTVRRSEDGGVAMDFPAQPPTEIPPPDWLTVAVGQRPAYVGTTAGQFLLALLANEADVRELRPDLAAITRYAQHGLIVTAAGQDVDFVSRCFAPGLGVDEDPVTGAAHIALAPFWAQRLGRTEFRARQLSARGGMMSLRLLGDRVELTGRAVTVLDGTIDTGAAS